MDSEDTGDGTVADSRVTDAHVILKVYSGILTAGEMAAALGVPPTEFVTKGERRGPRSPEQGTPSHGYFFLTRDVIDGLDINEHVAALTTAFGDMRRLNAFCAREDVWAEVTVYHWTTDGSVFRFDRESLKVLAALDIPVWFHVVQYPD